MFSVGCICYNLNTSNAFFFSSPPYGLHILIELLWLELISGEFASFCQSMILHITKEDYKYFPPWGLKFTIVHCTLV